MHTLLQCLILGFLSLLYHIQEKTIQFFCSARGYVIFETNRVTQAECILLQ